MTHFLIFINAWYSKKLVTGGENHMIHVAKLWSRSHTISFVIPKMAYDFVRRLMPANCHFYFSSGEGDSEINSTLRLSLLYLIRMIQSSLMKVRDRPDAIITASHFMYDVIPAVIINSKFKAKLVVYAHGILRSYRSYSKGTRSNLSLMNEWISLKFCKRYADLVLAMNEETKVTLLNMGFSQDRICVIGNGLDHEFIDSIQSSSIRLDGCFCGRLIKRKGVYDLISVWEGVLRKLPKSKLAIIGQGLEYERLKQLISKRGLEDSVTLTGYLTEEEKISIMKSSKIFLFPSYEEAWGIAISEAMACQLAVVGYDLPAYSVFGEGIRKVPKGDTEEFTSNVLELLIDQDARSDLALKGRKHIAKFTWDRIAQEEIQSINSMIETKR